MLNGGPLNSAELNSAAHSAVPGPEPIIPGYAFTWRPIVRVGDDDVTPLLTGEIEVDREEGAAGVAGENVGVYGINQGDLALNSGNYDLSYQGNNLTITKALLNVIADAKTKVYGDADPALTYQVSGLKNGDTAGAVLNGGSLSRVAGNAGCHPSRRRGRCCRR